MATPEGTFMMLAPFVAFAVFLTLAALGLAQPIEHSAVRILDGDTIRWPTTFKTNFTTKFHAMPRLLSNHG